MVVIGCRVPRKFFVTHGKGESDITVHAGSYHLALKEAGIEMCNIMQYSSILPYCAELVEKPETLIHGSVLETISAVCHAQKGEIATAGVCYAWLYNRESGEKYGGIVCEYSGPKTEKEAKIQLQASLHEIYLNGFAEKYRLVGEQLIVRSFIPEKEHGSVVVSLCFVDYIIPVVENA